MKRFNQTTLVWDFQDHPPETDIVRTKSGPCQFWRLERLKIASPGPGVKSSTMSLRIGFGFQFLNNEEELEIEDRLELLRQKVKVVSIEQGWCVSFMSNRGEGFCDSAIRTTMWLNEILGISIKDHGFNWMSYFEVSQKTLVLIQGEWMDFADYLRHCHQLPQLQTATVL